MRKLFSVFVAATLLNGSSLFLVACAKKYYFDSNIWVITNAGIVTDASFNESAWDGASKYVVSQKDKEILPSNWKTSRYRASYYEPASHTPSDFKTAYLTAYIAGAKTLIIPGFVHGNTIGWAAELADNLIYIDGSSQNIHLGMDPKKPLATNVVGISYEAESSGFFAGIAAALWLNANQSKYPSGLKISTYGGMDNPGAVSNYMWGFLVAADVFNTIISNNNFPNLFKIRADILAQVQKMNPAITSLQKVEKVQNVIKNNESWFSQSFEVGHGKDISDELLSRRASIIFPVAGLQTQDTIDRIKYNKSPAKVIGVDTEQSKIYGEDIIVTSALKEIVTSTQEALQNIYSDKCGYQSNSNTWDNNKVTSECWINTDQSSVQHPTWTGIETTKSINENTVNFIHNKTDNLTKDTAFDKIIKVLQDVYSRGIGDIPPVAAKVFTTTLLNTYQNSDRLKAYILDAIEAALQ
ncbi:BMP family ABC transporter substrate-binding protein [Spiroplasma citri]|uniref:BMP family ABC transporter substrate-binding protein n=1 Tax=Spiroplasma citri TaxID=2133 RepID=Q14QD4_SPICI|nr:BMP family ABC transporter substrate-binding protein [Spiroplasma citri]APE73986.1 ABC-type transport system substrate-binding protein [Spiroplasma citri]QED23987.1 BMP family ABC transporter substrate-binding protein [Spiroplasma citri]QIA66272.1 BMP family ABC transporter substrate-binding protein [Spiroplasma citri]QIA68123.1 BMP family ABC transporter substrate-binding protein [Spiroplasma citri]QIA70000.1 BMP family ABC transporter substrate-binding protein [Spiroplasma citri]